MTSTNNLTQAILRYVNYNGWKCWRSGNHAVYSVKQKTFRKNPHTLLGISDIIGLRKDGSGRFIAIEVKTGKDKLSVMQEMFLGDVRRAGGIAIIARDFDSFVKDFEKEYSK